MPAGEARSHHSVFLQPPPQALSAPGEGKSEYTDTGRTRQNVRSERQSKQTPNSDRGQNWNNSQTLARISPGTLSESRHITRGYVQVDIIADVSVTVTHQFLNIS